MEEGSALRRDQYLYLCACVYLCAQEAQETNIHETLRDSNPQSQQAGDSRQTP